jgi:type IV secretory pathway protease TraF
VPAPRRPSNHYLRRPALVAALRRLAVLVVSSAGVTAAASLIVGALLGASADRSVSLGFYAVGCFLLVSGFFVGNRGPTRVTSESAGPSVLPIPGFATRKMRWATLEEQHETINNSAIFIGLGAILVIIGVLVDSRASLI